MIGACKMYWFGCAVRTWLMQTVNDCISGITYGHGYGNYGTSERKLQIIETA